MPRLADSAITKLLKLCDQLTPEERQAAMDILRHYGRKEPQKPTTQKKSRQKAPQSVGEAS